MTAETASPSILRCSSTADFLAALPRLTGFTALDSLFIVCFTGARSDGAMRINLPTDHSAEATMKFLDAVCKLLHETGSGTGGPAIVITTTQSFASTRGIPWRRLGRALQRRFRNEGWSLRELAVVATDGWAGLLDPTTPALGRPLSEITGSPISSQEVRGLREPVPIETLGKLPKPDPKRTVKIQSQLDIIDQRKQSRNRTTEPPHTQVPIHGIARVAGACFDAEPGQVEPRLTAKLISATEYSDRWLIVALTALTRPEFIIGLADEAAELGQPQPFHTERTRHLLESLSHLSPDGEKMRRTITVLTEIAAHTPEPRRAGLLALIAWAWWHLGMGTVSGQVCEQAQALDPNNAEVRLVAKLTETAPGWQRSLSVSVEHAALQR